MEWDVVLPVGMVLVSCSYDVYEVNSVDCSSGDVKKPYLFMYHIPQKTNTHVLFVYISNINSILYKGMLFGMPDAFMRAKAKEALGKDLPPQGEYAVGNVFFPPENPDVLKDCKSILERLTKQRGLEVLGWRPVPVDNSMLGQDPLDSEPDTEQVSVIFNILFHRICLSLYTNKYMYMKN